MLLHVLEQTQSMLWNDPGLIQDQLTTIAINVTAPMAVEMTQAQNEANEIYLAIAFLSGADHQHYSPLLLEMENSYLQRINHYPTTLIQAYNELSNYQPDVHFMSWYPQAHDGVTFNMLETLEETASVDDESLTISTFATQGRQCGGGQGSWSGCRCRGGDSAPTHNANAGHGGNSQARNMDLSHVKCFWCHQLGHYASNCPVPYDEIVQMQAAPDSTEQSGGLDDESDHVQFRIMATTNLSIKSMVPKTWILLDTMSMVDVFSNPLLV